MSAARTSIMLETLRREKIVAIVRGLALPAADSTAQALTDGGIRLIEVTMNTKDALTIMAKWRERFVEKVCVGAGTVLDLSMAKQALSAGAQFLISPNVNESVIEYGLERGVEVWPGAFTSTEIVRAWDSGAHAVKVFPTGQLGPGYLKDLSAPLNHIPLIAVGGVNLKNAADFLRAGAIALGIGSSLVDNKLIQAGHFRALTELAQKYVHAVSATTPNGVAVS